MNTVAMFGSDVDPDAPVDDPLELLDRWLARADRTASDAPEADATNTLVMALATLGTDGFPQVRHVLLSAYDRGRLHFHTDRRTAKAAELAANPRATATLVWPEIPRQLAVSGNVVAETAAEEAAAYARRSRYLQLLAWVNDAEVARCSQADRKREWAEFDRQHAVLEPPPTWVGYALVAERITFWRGISDAPSQRVVCRRAGGSWSVERLPG